MSKHQEQTDSIHRPFDTIYADQATREAITTFVSTDIGKWYQDTDTGRIWELLTIAPTFRLIAGSYREAADKFGQLAHASGYFAAAGDAQGSLMIARLSVTHSDASWHELFLDGAAEQLTIASDTVWTFNILIAGMTSGSTKSFSFRIEGLVENDGGTTSIKASTVTTIDDADDVSFDARVTADDANDALSIEVQDSDGASDVVQWVASIQTAEVTF